MVCIFKSEEGRMDRLGYVKGAVINYVIWQTTFKVVEALDKYDLNIGDGKCIVKHGLLFMQICVIIQAEKI